MLTLAKQAMDDMVANFWDDRHGHITKEYHGYPVGEPHPQEMIWAHGQFLFGMYAYWRATGDEETHRRMLKQWEFIKTNFPRERLVTPGAAPNIAMDDAGWDAMVYVLCYMLTGDEYAHEVAVECIRNSYDYWKDGAVANGLWYAQVPPSQGGNATTRHKAIYSASLVWAALTLAQHTGKRELWHETLALYEWFEHNLR
ncbi:MAG: hypothetical protein FWF49_01510, partial [Oscillospiraceae bacterium]|nr:hypothetical protein [Oscillospiraceae bacterium]